MSDKLPIMSVVKKLPVTLGSFLTSLLILILGVGMRGDWILVAVNVLRHFEESTRTTIFSNGAIFQNVSYFLASSLVTSFTIYYVIGGFLQWYFYIRQRDNPEDWKCQPDKFLSWKDEKHEILLGSANMAIGAVMSGLLSCYILNGGKATSFYYKFDEYGWSYLLLSIPILFLYEDAVAYYIHRMLHIPFFYKNFHKMHHRYKQPTAFSATAMHPVEFLFFQMFFALPIFGPPIHWHFGFGPENGEIQKSESPPVPRLPDNWSSIPVLVVYTSTVFYIYYYGLMDHSGIKMKHFWPWQPHSMFHDDHHKYFHVNFGFNTGIWDTLHNTVRDPEKVYNEKIFFGHGKSKDEFTKQELLELEKEN